MTRPVQLGLLEGADKAVGPMLNSVVHGSNADLIAAVASLYLTGSVLDVTYGRGMWWQRYQPEAFTWHDLALDGVDFRQLLRPALRPTARRQRRAPRPRPGLPRPVRPRRITGGVQLRELIDAGIAECARVADRWVLAKCCDYTNGRQFHLGHVAMIDAARAVGLRCHDLIVHAAGTGPGGGQILTPLRARRAHSYLLVFTRRGRR